MRRATNGLGGRRTHTTIHDITSQRWRCLGAVVDEILEIRNADERVTLCAFVARARSGETGVRSTDNLRRTPPNISLRPSAARAPRRSSTSSNALDFALALQRSVGWPSWHSRVRGRRPIFARERMTFDSGPSQIDAQAEGRMVARM